MARVMAIIVAPPATIRVATFLTWSWFTLSALPFSFAVGSSGNRLKLKTDTRLVVTKLIPLLKEVPLCLFATLEQNVVTAALTKKSRRKATRLHF